jgi:hypothetical protein
MNNMEPALVTHAEAARDEVQHLIGEFMALAGTRSVPTPIIDSLLRYYEPDAPHVLDGSVEIPLRWGGMFVVLNVLAAPVTGCVLLAGWLFSPKRG